jgi:hypothetical protein
MQVKPYLPAALIAAGIVALCMPAPGRAGKNPADNQHSFERTTVPSSIPIGTQSEKEMPAMVKVPTTPFELLQNIKVALDHGLLLKEEFFTEEHLKQFSGGAKVRRSVGGPNSGPKDIFCEVTEFGPMVEPARVGNFVIPGMSLSLRRRILQDDRISGSLSVRFQQVVPSLSFDAVTMLFGQNWTYSKDLKSPHLKLESPRKPHGNAEIEYVFGDAKHKLSFGPDAILGSAGFVLHGENQ